MDNKALIIILSIMVLLTVNVCAAQDNNTDVVASDVDNTNIQSISEQTTLRASEKVDTQLNVTSATSFDVIGDYFKVKLSDANNNPISNAKVTFTLNTVKYTKITNNNGIASLQIKLNDGSYKFKVSYAGDSNYKSSSLTTLIDVNNTRVVKPGLNNDEIQNIIDSAKVNNVILFEGQSYSNVNLVINKRLTLLSKVGTVLKSNSLKPVISISGKNSSLTKIQGFDIQGNGNGIEIENSNYVTIIRNTISSKANGIVASNVKYLNITKNNIIENGENGITLALANSSHIYKNTISKNSESGIVITKSNRLYVYDNTISNNRANGVYLTSKINRVNYGEGPSNLYVTGNKISNNLLDGIDVENAGDNINLKGNTINSNRRNGISLLQIGKNSIQSNVLTTNWNNGIRFGDDYVKPSEQEINYNAIYGNYNKEIEAKDTYYYDFGEPLGIGDNWYSDYGLICPKIRTNNLRFEVKQVGENKFQATFYDSNNNVAALLPDRTLTYQTENGQILSVTISGGTGTFLVDAKDGDTVKAAVDKSERKNTYEANMISTPTSNGVTPSYFYPDIDQYQLYEDIEGGSGDGGSGGNDGDGVSGDGSNGSRGSGNGQKGQSESEFNANSTTSQNNNPGANSANQLDNTQSYDSEYTDSNAGASQTSSSSVAATGSSTPDSVVKKIVIDDDEIFRIGGISFIILLILLTIGLYYRDDIKEMKSKM